MYEATGQNVKKQPYEVLLCINEGLELVANVFQSFLARYLERNFAKRVVLLVPMPDTDIGTTALLLKLRSSNPRHNIAVSCLTTRRVQLQNRATCSVEISTSIPPYISNGEIEVEVSAEQVARFCN